jgi:hypothetical protein
MGIAYGNLANPGLCRPRGQSPRARRAHQTRPPAPASPWRGPGPDIHGGFWPRGPTAGGGGGGPCRGAALGPWVSRGPWVSTAVGERGAGGGAGGGRGPGGAVPVSCSATGLPAVGVSGGGVMGTCSLLADAVRASIMMPNRRRRRRACAKFFLSCLMRAFDGCSLGTE